MTKTSLTLVLPLCVALAGCSNDNPLTPDRHEQTPLGHQPPVERVLTGIKLTGQSGGLFTGDVNQVTISAWDQFGAPIVESFNGEWAGKVTYASSAPGIAPVNRSGVLTAVAPGRATITTTLTLGAATATDSVTIAVYNRGVVPAVYDLTAPITAFDPAWGDLSGHVYSAVVSLDGSPSATHGIVGTYTNFRLTEPDGAYLDIPSGIVTSSIDFAGRLVMELASDYFHFTLVMPEGDWDALASPVIEGHFGAGGHIGGTFTARRR